MIEEEQDEQDEQEESCRVGAREEGLAKRMRGAGMVGFTAGVTPSQ